MSKQEIKPLWLEALEYMSKRHPTPSDLADRIGASYRSVYRWRNGEGEPNRTGRLALIEAYREETS